MLTSLEKTDPQNNPNRIRLRPKLPGDAVDDYRWRKDPLLAYFDATSPVNISFEEYFKSYQDELERPFKNYSHFAIETLDGLHIGNCMLYDIDEYKKEAQLGILIGERAFWDNGYGEEAVTELLEKAFKDSRLSRIYLHTLQDNTRAQKCFAKCGFKICGQTSHNGLDFTVMEIHRDQIERLKIERLKIED